MNVINTNYQNLLPVITSGYLDLSDLNSSHIRPVLKVSTLYVFILKIYIFIFRIFPITRFLIKRNHFLAFIKMSMNGLNSYSSKNNALLYYAWGLLSKDHIDEIFNLVQKFEKM